jgi:hypothetical protein
MDYFIGGGSCQGLIPFDKGLWLASVDFNWVYKLLKPRIRVLLHSKKRNFCVNHNISRISSNLILSYVGTAGSKQTVFVFLVKEWKYQVDRVITSKYIVFLIVKKHIWYKLKIKKILLLPYMRGEIKIIDTQKKTATVIIV